MNNIVNVLLRRWRSKNYVVLHSRDGEVTIAQGYKSGRSVLLSAAASLAVLAARSATLAGMPDKFSSYTQHNINKTVAADYPLGLCACGGRLLPTGDAAFVEYGEYNANRYDSEGSGDIFCCEICGKTIIEFQVGVNR